MRAFLVAIFLARLAAARAAFAHQQRPGGEVLQAQWPLAAQRVRRRRHRDYRVVEERQELQVQVRRHLRHDQQVIAVGAQTLECLAVIGDHQLQADFRVLAAKSGEQVGC
ncbi:hypothetical protein D3C86_1726660 [compost metagenome]